MSRESKVLSVAEKELKRRQYAAAAWGLVNRPFGHRLFETSL